jgi:hypothetical protein
MSTLICKHIAKAPRANARRKIVLKNLSTLKKIKNADPQPT